MHYNLYLLQLLPSMEREAFRRNNVLIAPSVKGEEVLVIQKSLVKIGVSLDEALDLQAALSDQVLLIEEKS